jgi:hypothetical protein
MKKILFTNLLVLLIVLPSNAFSQTKNKFGFRFETGIDREITKSKEKGGFLRFFATPFWNLKDNTSIGIGAGLELHLEQQSLGIPAEIQAQYGSSVSPDELKFRYDYATVLSFPFYVSVLQKFRCKHFTPFVEGKLGYVYRDRYDVWDANDVFTEHPGKVDIRSTRKGGLFFSE